MVGAANGRAKVKLASGAELSATFPEGFAPGAKVTVVVRPEHARLVSGWRRGSAARSTMSSISAPTRTITCSSDGGGQFIVRQQNARNGESGFAAGDRVGIAIGDDAAQIVKD